MFSLGEGSRYTLKPMTVPKEAPSELERDFGQGPRMTDKREQLSTARGRVRWNIGEKFSAYEEELLV